LVQVSRFAAEKHSCNSYVKNAANLISSIVRVAIGIAQTASIIKPGNGWRNRSKDNYPGITL